MTICFHGSDLVWHVLLDYSPHLTEIRGSCGLRARPVAVAYQQFADIGIERLSLDKGSACPKCFDRWVPSDCRCQKDAGALLYCIACVKRMVFERTVVLLTTLDQADAALSAASLHTPSGEHFDRIQNARIAILHARKTSE